MVPVGTRYTKGLPVEVDAAIVEPSPDGVPFQCYTHAHEMFGLIEQFTERLVSLFEKFGEPSLFFSLFPMPGDDVVRHMDVAMHNEASLASTWEIGLKGDNHRLRFD